MFWKNVKIHLFDKFIPKHPRRWSITFRHTMIYTFSVLSILFITTLTLYWIFTARLEKENQKFLINNMLVLQTLLQNQSNYSKEFLREEIVVEPAIYHYFVRVVDETGQILLETPGMSENVPIAAFQEILPVSTDTFPATYWDFQKKNHKTKHFLLMTALVGHHQNPNQDRMIQIAKDISAERNIVVDYRRGLLFVLLIGVIFSASIGVWVTRKGLQPLREITQSTQRITIERLKERLDPYFWPSELSELAIAFNGMLDRIENGFTRLSQFSGDLAHELRTPISNLMGEAEIALSRSRNNEEYREVLGSSLEELERLSYMIDNLLFLARAENPQTVVTYAAFETHKMMQDMCDFYEVIAEEKNIKLYHQGNALIKADAFMVRRAVSNLISNAIKHTFSGGLISLSSGVHDDKKPYISISDNGEGIATTHLPHLFDRFYRVDSARSQQTGGTGLGLAIVKFIMDLHGGSVSVVSQIGKGTTVSLLFPA